MDHSPIAEQIIPKGQTLDPVPSLVDFLYPPDQEECLPYREQLTRLLRSSCIRDCTTGDAEYTKYFFTKLPRGYYCSVLGCSHLAKRLDRATNHFRSHINHRPYACTGLCGKGKCNERFYAKETLTAHTRTKKVICDQCGFSLEAKNLGRHRVQNRACKEGRRIKG